MRFSRMITAVDAHAEGEPGRVITGGVGPIPGDTVFAQMQFLAEQQDEIRRLMLREPRGYPGLCCNLLVPPTDPMADMGFIIMEQMEYPAMSGSNTICVATVLLETGILPMTEPVTELTLEAPAGLVKVRADCADGKVTRVTFENVPGLRAALERAGRGAESRHDQGRRRLGRNDVRALRGLAGRAAPDPGRGRRLRQVRRDGQGGHARAVPARSTPSTRT